MATDVSQRGTVVKVNSKGQRVAARPFRDDEVDLQQAENASPFGANLARDLERRTIGQAQALPDRRKREIDVNTGDYVPPAPPDAPGYTSQGFKKGGKVAAGRGFKAGGMVRRGYGKARGA